MIAFPPCKINLGLNIISRRADGYHNIETCFLPIPWTDVLEIIPSSKLEFRSSGLSIPGNAEQNLCLKAYHLLREDFTIPPVYIHLHKVIPTGAGLGGGSSDGAWTLRMLNQQFNLNLNYDQLSGYAGKLGSDCSFFLHNDPRFGSGKGDILTPISLKNIKGKHVVVIKPDAHVSTAEAYSGVVPAARSIDLKKSLEVSPVEEWKTFLKNDFEASVFRKYPVIGELKKELYNMGALYASMSGSGSAVFGIFDSMITLPANVRNPTSWQGQI